MKIIEKMAAIIAGSMLVGVGINFFLIPYHLLDGGMIGIGLIFHYYIGLPTGLGVILSSIPLYIYAWYFEKNYLLTACMAYFFPPYVSIFFPRQSLNGIFLLMLVQ